MDHVAGQQRRQSPVPDPSEYPRVNGQSTGAPHALYLSSADIAVPGDPTIDVPTGRRRLTDCRGDFPAVPAGATRNRRKALFENQRQLRHLIPPFGPGYRSAVPRPANRPPRVLLDATPLLGVRTGIGRYVEHLVQQLAGRSDLDVRATAFTLRGWRALASQLPVGVRSQARPVPARLLRACWRTAPFPPVEWVAGRSDVVHGTNFVLPPSRHAAGVLTIHDLAFLTHADTMRRATADLAQLVRRAVDGVSAVTTLADATRIRIAEDLHVPLEKIVVAAPGVDDRWFQAAAPGPERRAELGLPEHYLVFVGTREPRKGLDVLLQAYAWLRDELGSAAPELVLVGPAGWGADPTVSRVDGVRLTGYVAQEVLPEIVAGSLALVLPSLDEGFGMPSIEALATGRPVVVSDIPVLAEVTGPVGIRFPVGDVDALAAALVDAIGVSGSDSSDRRTWARQFTWERCAERTVDAYRIALASKQ